MRRPPEAPPPDGPEAPPPGGRDGRTAERRDGRAADRLRRLAIAMFGAYALAVLLVAATALVGLYVESAVRSYVKGESLWSKAQKEAVFALDEYAAGGELRHWERYLEARDVSVGDRQARLELDRPNPDPERVERGFRRGGLQPYEIPGMSRLYRWFGGWAPMRRAVASWARGDSLMAELHRTATALRVAWGTPPPDPAAIAALTDRIEALNGELHEVELAFTETMSRAGDTVHRWAMWAVGGLTLLLLAGGGGLTRLGYGIIRRRERQLERAEQRYRSIFENSRDAIYVSRRDGTIVAMNEAGLALTGYSAEELETMRAHELYDDPRDRAKLLLELERRGFVDGYDLRLVTKEGEVRECELTSSTWNEDGEVVGYQGIIRDVTERREFERELRRRALHDPLTRLPNRALLWDRLDHALRRSLRAGEPLAVLFVDLDRFKLINDGISHAAGDQVLVQIARILTGCLRAEDTVARVGGDEFVILLEEAGDVAGVADRIVQALQAPLAVDGQVVHLDASIGVTSYRPSTRADGESAELAERLVRQADAAMYRAKQMRGSTWCAFEEGMIAEREPTLRRENELRAAIAEGQIVVHYQPIVRLADGAIVAVEPLARWDHPTGGLLPPSHFLPLAEETGLILELGFQVFRSACAQVADWNATLRGGDPLTVHPNLSAAQLEDPRLEARLEAILEETGLAAERIEVELTEHSVMRAPDRTRLLARLGLGICIDDFGTGYSSLTGLKQLAADCLKIDLSFIRGIGTSRLDEAIIRVVLTLTRTLGLDHVAEGVETEEQRRWLAEEGCVLAQGHLFGRPVPPEEFARRLTEEGRRVPL